VAHDRLAADVSLWYGQGITWTWRTVTVIDEHESETTHVSMTEPERLGLISQSDLAAALEINVRTLSRWERHGILPRRKLFNRSVFFDKAEVAGRLTDRLPKLWRVVARRVLAARHVLPAA